MSPKPSVVKATAEKYIAVSQSGNIARLENANAQAKIDTPCRTISQRAMPLTKSEIRPKDWLKTPTLLVLLSRANAAPSMID